MTYRLAIIDPPEADCFSFAALSAANENNVFLCDLCVSAVNIIQIKTLSGSPFKPPVLRGLVNFRDRRYAK